MSHPDHHEHPEHPHGGQPRRRHSDWLDTLIRNVKAGSRLALFLPVSRAHFSVGVIGYAQLAVFSVLVWLTGSFMRVGVDAQFVPGAGLALLGYIPILLLFCLIAARVLRDDSLFPALAVMLGATDLVFEIVGTLIYLVIDRDWLPLPPTGQFAVYVLYVLWAIAIVLRAQRLLVPWSASGARTAAGLLIAMVMLMVYLPRSEPWQVPVTEESESVDSMLQEDVLSYQDGLLQRELDRLAVPRPGEPDLYFIGAAPHAGQPTFMLELATIRKQLDESFDTAGRSVALINHSATLKAAPIATSGNLRNALGQVGEMINPEEDVLMLFITTHGSQDHVLSFELPPLRLNPVNPTALARMLADSGAKWKIIVLSACYSGGFIEALRDENSLIITASDATRPSFGCEVTSEFTWFSRAFFDQALREEAKSGRYSFLAAFERAKQLVAEQEKAAGFEPSNPQIHIGAAMREKLKVLEAKLQERARNRVPPEVPVNDRTALAPQP